MKMRETLAKVQAEAKCEHVKVSGEPCDDGSWWTCSCAVLADKMVSEYQRALSQRQGT